MSERERRGARIGERAHRWASQVPAALVFVIALGVLLRIAIAIAVSPAELNNVDTLVYVGMAKDGLFGDPVRPAGYSIFLRALHAVSAELSWTIFVQHLIGIATAVLLYAAVRRIGAPLWAGVVAAAAVLLSLDQIYLEHTILAETVFTLTITAVFYCCVRALDEPEPLWRRLDSRIAWIVAAGLLLGLSAWLRTIGVTLAPLLALWFALAIAGSWRARIARGLVAAVASAAVILGYFALHEAERGYFGLTDGSGRVLLGRVSPFADCTRFDPPAGTEALCEDTPTEERLGSDYYIWDLKSPAWREFGPLPAEDALAREFAMEVIFAQPLDYVGTVASDTLRHFVPFLNDERLSAGTPYDWMKIERRDAAEGDVFEAIDGYYDTGPPVVRTGLAGPLSDLQDVLRVHQVVMLQAVIISGFGLWFSRGRVRAAIALLIGAGILMLLIPSITATYNARYAVPLGGAFAAATALSAWVLLDRYARRVRATTEAA